MQENSNDYKLCINLALDNAKKRINLLDNFDKKCVLEEYKGNMSATKREEVCSHLRYIRLELREMHQMLIKEDLLPDLNEAKEVLAQLDALLDLLSEKKANKIKSQF